MNNSCLLCGVGGQGTVLASKLIAFAAMEKGLNVRTAETIGMAQRGGCVVSHARMGEDIPSPLIPRGGADVIIGFEPAEAARNLSYLKKDGVVVVNPKPVIPVTASLSGAPYRGEEMLDYLKQASPRLLVVNGDGIARRCGSAKVVNVALLAAAAHSGSLGLTVEDIRRAVERMVPQRFHAVNFRAIALACGEENV